METAIIAAIEAAAPGIRCYHDVAPHTARAPFVVLQQVGGQGYLHIDIDDSDYGIRLQLAVWAAGRLECNRISRDIERGLIGLPGVVAVGAGVADVDTETGLRGMRQDFRVRHG